MKIDTICIVGLPKQGQPVDAENAKAVAEKTKAALLDAVYALGLKFQPGDVERIVDETFRIVCDPDEPVEHKRRTIAAFESLANSLLAAAFDVEHPHGTKRWN